MNREKIQQNHGKKFENALLQTVTKTKDSYLYKKLRSAERIWRCGDWVTAGEHTVLTRDYAVDRQFRPEISYIQYDSGGGGGGSADAAVSLTYTLAPPTSHT